MTIEFKATEFETMHEAIQWSEASGCGAAVLLDGRKYAMKRAEAERLEVAGVEFSYLFDHALPTGEHRIIGVPVND